MKKLFKNFYFEWNVPTIMLLITVMCLIPAVLINGFLYYFAGCTGPDPSISYEEEFFANAEEYSTFGNTFISDINIVSVDNYDCDFYEVHLSNGAEPTYHEVLKNLYGEYLANEEVDAVTNFAEFSHKERRFIQSARDIVTQFINDSTILRDKEYLVEQINNIPFRLYTSSEQEELNNNPIAVYIGRTIYCNSEEREYFSEFAFVHELFHYLRFLCNGEDTTEERYFGGKFDEATTDLLTYSTSAYAPSTFVSSYADYYSPILEYYNVFGTDALYAYFYGYDEFFEKYDLKNDKTFITEHDAFVGSVDFFSNNLESRITTHAFTASWNSRYA